jgi:hypothetical protein
LEEGETPEVPPLLEHLPVVAEQLAGLDPLACLHILEPERCVYRDDDDFDQIDEVEGSNAWTDMPPKRCTRSPPMVGEKTPKNWMIRFLIPYPVARLLSVRLFVMKMLCVLKTRFIVRVPKLSRR